MIRLTKSRITINGIRRLTNTAVRFNPKKIDSPPPIPEIKNGNFVIATPPSINPVPIENEIPPPPPPPSPKKKKFSFSGFLFKTSLLAIVLYGGTMYLATKNNKVLDFVLDNDLPYNEQLIDFFENLSKEDFEELWYNIQNKFTDVKLPTKSEIGELTTKLEHRSEDFLKETKKKLSSKKDVRKGTDLTPVEQLQKPVEVESLTRDVLRLPLIELDAEVANSVDSSVKQIISSFNNFVQSIDANTLEGSNSNLIKAIDTSVNQLASKLTNLTTNFDNELQNKLKVSQTELVSSFTKKELELTENLIYQFNQEKAQLEKKLNKRLEQEVKAARQAISQAATNAVSMVRIEQTKNFEKLVTEKLNEEREGRLANLDKLNDKINDLEKFAESFEKQIVNTHKKTLIQQSINKLKSLLLFSQPENSTPKSIGPYVDILGQISTDDEVLNLALKDLIPLISNESTHSILSNSQLLTRWEQLAPELRSSSLLPPNAGLLGHLSSLIFSKLLVPVKGVKEDGKDIESVIGRVEYSLARGQLDVAVEEATNLKGWSRRLANDWVIEGRKRLEIEFLLGLIESEAKLL
ncbi:MIC60 [Candida pseudojiufengensis]|uniref:MIC60 n=1 Tax=Candida pseudojiufengensis TaxID=497109 RepID=UPI00222544CE|nr:MIC60 [Candida pseudojiufengensis]KAI5963606.1 MIC60 [Candida pseudojiufengensis]